MLPHTAIIAWFFLLLLGNGQDLYLWSCTWPFRGLDSSIDLIFCHSTDVGEGLPINSNVNGLCFQLLKSVPPG
jgi:hypothetical protein